MPKQTTRIAKIIYNRVKRLGYAHPPKEGDNNSFFDVLVDGRRLRVAVREISPEEELKIAAYGVTPDELEAVRLSETLGEVLARRFCKSNDLATFALQDSLRETGVTLVAGAFTDK